MSRYSALVIPSSYVDPVWGDFGTSLHSMGQGMREMDRLFGEMSNQYQQIAPSESRGRRSGHPGCFDVGFPDASIQNPVVTDKDGSRRVHYNFDLRQFKPEEINVKSFDDNRIEVSAKHETKDDNHQIYREYRRVCALPEGVDLKSVKSQLNPDGVLSIEAPLPAGTDAPKKEAIQSRNEPIPMQIEHQGKGK